MTVPKIIVAILHCLSNGWHVGLLCAFGLYQQATKAWDVRSCAILSDLWTTRYRRVDESTIVNWWTLTSVYNKHFNKRHSVTLEKHWNLFSVWALPRTLRQSSRCFPRPVVRPLDDAISRVNESTIVNWHRVNWWSQMSIYNKHFNKRHSVMLEMHWNLFSVWAVSQTLRQSSGCFPRPIVGWGGEPSPSSFLCAIDRSLLYVW